MTIAVLPIIHIFTEIHTFVNVKKKKKKRSKVFSIVGKFLKHANRI